MDLFKLLGTISVDNKEANKALDETGDKGEKAESKLGKAFSAIGKGAVAVGKAVGTGMIAAGTAVAGLVTKSVSAYAEYEQLVGGIETLFGTRGAKTVEEYAAIVGKSVDDVAAEFEMLQKAQTTAMDNAKAAYETAGLSANEYMQTISSFAAALKQSTASELEAAELANMAVIDMSDNANKMGTSMEAIQNAYNGFSKQNYTMLDNLKLGYGGTKTEMERLLKDAEKLPAALGKKFDISNYADVVEAIHLIQDNMGITDTTANEAASTISGSMNMMKSAWTNLVTAMSDKDANLDTYISTLVDSVVTVGNNLMPVIETSLNGAVRLIDQLAPVLIGKIPDILSQILPTVVDAASNIIDAVVNVLPGIVTTITDMLPSIVRGFRSIVEGLISAIPSVLKIFVDAIPNFVPFVVNAIEGLFITICEVLPQLLQPLLDALPDMIELIVLCLIDAFPGFFNGITELIMSLVNMIAESLPEIVTMLGKMIIHIIEMIAIDLPYFLPLIVDAITTLITMLGEQIPAMMPMLVDVIIKIINVLIEQLPVIIPMVLDACIQIIQAVIENLPVIVYALVKALPAILVAVWDAIVMIFENIPAWFGQLFDGAVLLIEGAFHSVVAFFQGIWDGIAESFGYVGQYFGNVFSAAWDAIALVFDVAVDYFKTVWKNIKLVFAVVKDVLSGNFKDAWEKIKQIFSNVGSFFAGVWDKIKTTFSSIGTKIADAISGAVKGGINGLLGSAEKIINGFLKMINGAIDLINLIPGVNISKVKMVEFQRLAKGGVVDEATPAVFGEDGAELLDGNTVVPLENNTGWMNKVARNLHSLMMDTAVREGSALYGYRADSGDDKLVAAIRADVESMKDTMNGMLDILSVYMPDIRERMDNPVPAVIGAEQAADALIDPIDYRLGRLAIQKGRGRR